MQIRVFVDKENKNKQIELKDNATVSDMLSALNINPVTVIVVKNKEIVMQNEHISIKDEIKILSVVSGG